MKHFISTTLLFITILSASLNAQQISADAYNKDFIHEDFNQEGNHFKVITTTDNYFILDKGDYLLSRNNKDSEYAIIASNSSVSNFVLKTAIRIGPSNNKKASIGIIIKAQQDGKGAIIFEINKKGEYRVKQLLGNTYKTLSGTSKQEGWVKSKIINGVDEHNFVEIRTENNIYDVYVNSEYLTAFFIPDYTSGSCGLIISPETKARISFYYLNTKGGKEPVASYKNEDTPNTNATIEQLNKKITTLEENNATLNSLNTEARTSQEEELKTLRTKNTNQATVTIEQEKEIASLNRTITDLKSNTSKITELENTINNNGNEINNLTTENNSLTAKTESLTAKNNEFAAVTIEQEKEISTLNYTITTLKDNKSAKVTELENTINNNGNEINNLTTENNSLTAKTESLTAKNNEFAAVTIEQEKEISTLNYTITTLKNNKSAKITELENTISNNGNEIIALTTAIDNSRNKSANANATNKQLTKKVDALKKQITLEKATNTDLTNDFNKATKSSKANSTQLNNKISTLKTETNKLKKTNATLTVDLSIEKAAHSKTKKGLSKSITTKTDEIKALQAQLNTNKQQLNSVKKNGALAKECAKNAATLSADLKKAKQEINVLQNIKNKHDDIVNDLNSQVSLLKANKLTLNTDLQTLNKKISQLETTNTELKELFILKDFKVNGVKPSNLTKQTTTYPTPKEIKGNSTIYAVQFGVYMQVQPKDGVNVDEVWYETTEHGTYIYLSGQFKSPQEATAHKNTVAALGYPNAFVVTLTK